ncbi:TetR family transcriptional regulator [Streptomyces spiroverticillatus]|uniref:TetR family transcriptional regulator n=1 Tax=Streptomyces finlayi TaxID=67296 RepID=A0A918X2W7_9ACTN|nr:TetR/AcrR family transcriptional regulator [Streptomyces finlayi]GGZ94399.1 TetR family transcriptional regulator [Streptomyces spiroverticillatus]GHD06783.1 TetR family transcriptional regulator [Streptomyces finlayi]
METTKTPDSSRRSERSRRAIFDAALALVGEVGYQKTTIEGIAARAGVGKQTIYRWWSSKAAVLLDAYSDLADQAAAAVGEVGAAIPDTGDLAADLRFVLRATVDELVDPTYDIPTRALTAEGVVDAALCAQYVERLLRPSLQLYVDRLAASRERGEVRADLDLDTAVEMFTGPLSGRWLMRTGPLTHAYADRLVDYALKGLEPR